MIQIGDIVVVRTFITQRKVKAKVIDVNYKHGWYTVEIKTDMGNYRESHFIRDVDTEASKRPEARNKWWGEDNPDKWLDEWSEDKYGK